MTDYRFSSGRGRNVRVNFGALVPYTTAVLTPLPSTLGTWTEPFYTAQDEAYAARRIPVFVQNLNRIETESQRIDTELRNRSAAGTVVGSGEQAVIVMPVTGACPANGPLAYAYEDLFTAAQANLAALGREKPPRYSPFNVIERWAKLIALNIDLLFIASNIHPRYRFPDAQPRSWMTPDTIDGSRRTIHVPNETKEGYPYPQYNGQRNMALPQSAIDTMYGMEVGLRSALRLSTDPSISNFIPPESCVLRGECPRPSNTYHRFLTASLVNAAFRTYEGANHLLSAPTVQLFRDDYRSVDHYRKSFEPTPDELRTGQVYSGSSSTGYGGAWTTLSTVFLPIPSGARDANGQPYTGKYYWNPISALLFDQSLARDLSRVSLPRFIAESVGWYVYNHNVWYAEKLNLTVEELLAQQRALASAGLDRTSGPIVGVVGAVGSAINPAIGVVVGIINSIGKELLLSFINVSPDLPKPLFLRISDPNVCEGRPEEQIDTDSGSSDDGGTDEEGISPLAVAGASALALLLLWAAQRRS